MSLILPPWGFANGVNNLTGTPPVTDAGTSFTAGANNTDGTAVEVLSDLAFDGHYLIVGVSGVSNSAANSQALLDILTDPAGGTSYGSFIDDLICGFTEPQAPTVGIVCWYHFPIYIPAGSAIAVQARTRHTSDITTGKVVMQVFGNPSRPEMWWCGQKVESLGINATISQGTNISPGSSGADGTWTTMGTSSHRYGAIQFGISGSDGSASGRGYYWDVGIGSTALPGAPRCYRSQGTAEISSTVNNAQPIWCDVAASTDWQLRGTCSGAPELFNAAIYGVY